MLQQPTGFAFRREEKQHARSHASTHALPNLTPGNLTCLPSHSLVPQPFGEDGSGYYSEATKGCYDVIANAKELVTHAVDRALAARAAAGTQGSLFTVADFGTADAGTSMVSACSVQYSVVRISAVQLSTAPRRRCCVASMLILTLAARSRSKPPSLPCT